VYEKYIKWLFTSYYIIICLKDNVQYYVQLCHAQVEFETLLYCCVSLCSCVLNFHENVYIAFTVVAFVSVTFPTMTLFWCTKVLFEFICWCQL